MTEPCTSKKQGRKRGNTNRNSSDMKVLMEWRRFEEVENIVKPYVTEVIRKAVSGGYKTAREVFDDYKIFNSLRTKLTEVKEELMVESYANELIFYYGLEKKAMMLRSFSSMLSDAALQDEHKKWIRKQKKKDATDDLLSYASVNIEYWDGTVNRLNEDLQSEIRQQKKTKGEFLETIHHEENEFQADNFVERKGEFEELNSKISSTEKHLDDVLFKRSKTCYETLEKVGDRSTLDLEKEFFKLLPPEEEDLAELWQKETEDMEELVQKEEEREKIKEKAIEICKASWSNVIGSSGRY
ncbi:hypothetical protein MKW92_032345 [Papaver armeniacum]|nr:hypothetical protein MKW92_032345 [Papaver armeniacum]